jgi:hypothetical protein
MRSPREETRVTLDFVAGRVVTVAHKKMSLDLFDESTLESSLRALTSRAILYRRARVRKR